MTVVEARPPIYQVSRDESLPRLAWLFDHRGDGATLFCGQGVELFDAGFFEGAWAAPFGEVGFADAVNVFGSGMIVSGEAFCFTTPSHVMEGVYIYVRPTGFVASNSLTFLLTHIGEGLVATEWRYGTLFGQSVHGLGRSPIAVPTTGGEIHYVYHHNLEVSFAGQWRVVPKPLPPPFPDFTTYRDYLVETLEATAANAGDSRRKRSYDLVTTLSSGYDSAVGATLARAVGCHEALTLLGADGSKEDCGVDVARALGVDLKYFAIPRDADATTKAVKGAGCEAEFLAAGMGGEDFVYSVFEPALPGKLLLTGFHGDVIWAKWHYSVPRDNRDIERGDISGHSLGEFRLRVDFVHLPTGFIGAQRYPEILAISNSPELEPFVIGGKYDRPIPRRIIESAGARRQDFGQVKRAQSFVFFDGRARFSKETREAIARYATGTEMQRFAAMRATLRRWIWRLRMGLYPVIYPPITRLTGISGKARYWWGRVLRRLGYGAYALAAVLIGERRFIEHGHPDHTHWQRWAIKEISGRYVMGDTKRSQSTHFG